VCTDAHSHIGYPRFIKWPVFWAEAPEVVGNGLLVVIIFGSVHGKHHAGDDDDVRVRVHGYVISISLADDDAVSRYSGYLLVVLKDGISDTFVLIQTELVLVAFAQVDTLPAFFTLKLIEIAPEVNSKSYLLRRNESRLRSRTISWPFRFCN
jgi:hypothetical protein